MEFPTIDKFVKDVAEKALDEFIYEGKTIREWIEIIVKQQPCEDCIRREDAIGIVARIKEMHIDDRERYPINYGTICDIDLALQQLPTVTPHQTRWIPVSERLPEEEGWYLVTDASGGLRMTEHSFYMPQEDKMEEPYWDYMNVVAWMPLPEPYRESEDKNDKI